MNKVIIQKKKTKNEVLEIYSETLSFNSTGICILESLLKKKKNKKPLIENLI